MTCEAHARLGPRGWRAAHLVIRRVRRSVHAPLRLAALFGSRARGDARGDSDVDLLLVFEWLPPDREPHATQAERIAEQVAGESGVPISVWSVSLSDLRRGRRTPMLVDALEDALPLWPRDAPVPVVPFTPADALFCARCLLERVEEGSDRAVDLRARGRHRAAAAQARDDVVRLCTAALLLRGHTRPRRAGAVRALLRLHPDLSGDPALRWVEGAYPEVRCAPPWPALEGAVARLRRHVRGEMEALAGGAGLASPGDSGGPAPGPRSTIAS